MISQAVSDLGQLQKLLTAICNNPKDVRFDDACRVASELGYSCKKGDGSHRAYAKPGDPVGLNFQNHNGKIKPYQARQLIAAIERYKDQD